MTAVKGNLQLDALIVRPTVSRLVLTGVGGRTELINSASTKRVSASVGAAGVRSVVHVYDKAGKLVGTSKARGVDTVKLPAGGFAVVSG